MKGFIEFQNAINRSYALEKTGVPDPRKLSKEEKDALEIKVKVEKGSSIFQINLPDQLVNLGGKVIDKMDPTTLAISGVAIATMWFGTIAWKQFLQYRKEKRESEVNSESERAHLETMQFMSEQETKRAKMLTDFAEKVSYVDNTSRFSDDARIDLLKSLSHASVAEIDGVAMDDDLVKQLTKNARRKSEEVRLDGTYRVRRNDTTDPDVFKVRLENVENSSIIDATVQDDSITTPIKVAIQQAEWQRIPVELKVNAKSLEGTIRNAVVIGLKDNI